MDLGPDARGFSFLRRRQSLTQYGFALSQHADATREMEGHGAEGPNVKKPWGTCRVSDVAWRKAWQPGQTRFSATGRRWYRGESLPNQCILSSPPQCPGGNWACPFTSHSSSKTKHSECTLPRFSVCTWQQPPVPRAVSCGQQ